MIAITANYRDVSWGPQSRKQLHQCGVFRALSKLASKSKIIIFSDLGVNIGLHACQCEPSWPCFWSPSPQLRGWLLSREIMRSCRCRGSSGSWQRQRQGARLWKGLRGACAAPRTSLSLSQPLQALPLKHPHRVSKDGKWVREGCFSDSGKHSLLSFSPCSQWAVCPAACTAAAAAIHRQQQPTVGGSLIHKITPDRILAKSLRTQKLIPRPPYELKTKIWFIFEYWCHKMIVDKRYLVYIVRTLFLVLTRTV